MQFNKLRLSADKKCLVFNFYFVELFETLTVEKKLNVILIQFSDND